MTEEIKEISKVDKQLLDKIEYILGSELSNEEYDKFYNYFNEIRKPNILIDIKDVESIKDYITNLQKENEKLKELCDKYEEEHNTAFKLWKANMEKIPPFDKFLDYKQRNEKAIENAKEKIKRYESYIHDLKNGNYPSPTIRQERQELIFRIREQEDLINILQGGDE